MKKHWSSQPRGFSLIELLLVLGVLAILLVAAFVVYPQVRARNQANTEAANVRTIQANVRTLFYSKNGSYAGIGNGRGATAGPDRGIANQARVFPVTMNGGDYSADAVITTSWGGEVWVWRRPAVTTASGSFAAGRTFGILLEKVPQSVCLPLISAVSGSFVAISVGTNQVITADGLDPAAAAAACDAVTDSTDLMFTSL